MSPGGCAVSGPSVPSYALSSSLEAFEDKRANTSAVIQGAARGDSLAPPLAFFRGDDERGRSYVSGVKLQRGPVLLGLSDEDDAPGDFPFAKRLAGPVPRGTHAERLVAVNTTGPTISKKARAGGTGTGRPRTRCLALQRFLPGSRLHVGGAIPALQIIASLDPNEIDITRFRFMGCDAGIEHFAVFSNSPERRNWVVGS